MFERWKRLCGQCFLPVSNMHYFPDASSYIIRAKSYKTTESVRFFLLFFLNILLVPHAYNFSSLSKRRYAITGATRKLKF